MLVARTLSGQETPKPRCNILVLQRASCTSADTAQPVQSTWSKLQHRTTCCNAHIEAAECATIGLSRAILTPSQIVITAAAAVAHTASIKSQQYRAPPAIDIACCVAQASTRACTTACVVDSVLLAKPHVGLRANVRLPCLCARACVCAHVKVCACVFETARCTKEPLAPMVRSVESAPGAL